ncbi:4-hydroxy-tetrahydrodipicolinate synthase [Saxibacter everestensis]|uniref:4-hydroxy-tetrahydrodipicolinate synthase n=1 Tax=Saxibacter everestensis TaxID=2909229 RepID=A0ABY8R0L2_9MICO|nr:4-hydroxy-tetrahydrodipicolinate synthase [Brevibacteriaceae bacterium ZFBP1038]
MSESHTAAITAFGTVSTAMATPFRADGALDLDGAAKLASYLVDLGNNSLVVSGTTGESPTTSDEEQDALLKVVLEAVGDRARVIAGVGTNDTAHSVQLARVAAETGAHGVLVVTPYYSKPPQSGIQAHIETVADATDLPVMIYDIPGRSGVPISTETLVRLAEHPRILAVKDAKGDLYETSWVMARSDLAYYSGEDALNYALLTHGAVGVVSVVGHVAAKAYAEMIGAVRAGNLLRARELHYEVLPVVRAIMTRTQGAIAVKAALEAQGVLTNRMVRLPLLPATDEEIRVLTEDLRQNGYL